MVGTILIFNKETRKIRVISVTKSSKPDQIKIWENNLYYGDKCFKCNGFGHTSAECRQKNMNVVSNEGGEENEQEEYEKPCKVEDSDEFEEE